MRLLYGHDAEICAWVSERVGAKIDNGRAIGVVDDGDYLVAGVAYSNYRGCDMEMSCASETPEWLSKERLRIFFAYPFGELGLLRVSAIADKKNKRGRKFIERIGFKLEGVHPKALDGRDAVSYGMLAQDCKYFRITEHG